MAVVDWFSGWGWMDGRFSLDRLQQIDRTPARVWVADLAPPVWSAAFEAWPLPEAEADALESAIDRLGGALVPFWVHPPRRPVPLSVAGAVAPNLGAPVVASIAADRSALSLSGLPAGFAISAGDFVSVDLAAGGAAFVRFAASGVASAGGVTPQIAVAPAVPAEVSAGMVARLDRPRMLAQMVPGSVARSRLGFGRYVISFDVGQV